MKYLFALLKGILAGMAIAFGGFLFTVITHYVPNEGGKILGSFIFPLGLMMVCLFKLNLFTGKIGLVFEKKQTKDFYIFLPIMYIGNFIGALGIGYLCYAIFKDTEIFIRITSIAAGKTNLTTWENYFALISKALITGLCVYLAVKAFGIAKKKYQGIILLFIFIAIFVYIGGDHCVANMFYFSFANKWTANAFINIALATVMNSLGTLPGVLLFKQINK